MSITFPTFIDKEIVTPEKLNDFVQALEAKFAAGLSSAEIVWPLNAGGNLQMGDWSITGGQSIWGIYNADQYTDDWDTCLSDGAGGCIVIPPNTTVTMDGAAMTGSSLTIKGSGPSSILALEAGASGGYALRNETTAFEFVMSNLTLDGQDIADNLGLYLRGCAKVEITDCTIKDFAFAAIKLEYMGQNNTNVRITNCTFGGGSSHAIECLGVDNIIIEDCIFQGVSADCIDIQSESGDQYAKHVSIKNNVFDGCTGRVINITGNGSSFDALRAHIKVEGNSADTLNSMTIGDATHKLQYVTICNNQIPSSSGDALQVCAQYGDISGNLFTNATSDAIDLSSSQFLTVKGNNLYSATIAGVRAADAKACLISDNLCTGAGTTVVISTHAATPCQYSGNSDGDVAEQGRVSTYVYDSEPLVIPANTLRVGDTVHILGLQLDDAANIHALTFAGKSIIELNGVGNNDNAFFDARLFINGTTTAIGIASAQCDNTTDASNAGHPQPTGLDLTADINITITGATAAPARLMAIIGRGVNLN